MAASGAARAASKSASNSAAVAGAGFRHRRRRRPPPWDRPRCRRRPVRRARRNGGAGRRRSIPRPAPRHRARCATASGAAPPISPPAGTAATARPAPAAWARSCASRLAAVVVFRDANAGPVRLRLGGDNLVLDAQLPAQPGELRVGAQKRVRTRFGQEALAGRGGDGGDHAASAVTGLDYRDWMTGAGELPGGGQPGDTSSHNDGFRRHDFVLW